MEEFGAGRVSAGAAAVVRRVPAGQEPGEQDRADGFGGVSVAEPDPLPAFPVPARIQAARSFRVAASSAIAVSMKPGLPARNSCPPDLGAFTGENVTRVAHFKWCAGYAWESSAVRHLVAGRQAQLLARQPGRPITIGPWFVPEEGRDDVRVWIRTGLACLGNRAQVIVMITFIGLLASGNYALAAASGLPSRAAVGRLVDLTLSGLRPAR